MKSMTLVLTLFLSLALGVVTHHVVAGEPHILQTQVLLKKRGYNPGAIDGVYGKDTSKAVRRFQKDHGLHVTGKMDPQTRRALERRPLPPRR